MPARRHNDAGQALPVYITVVGGLLFLALVYFAVGQAAAKRSEAQTAADAAALAAALETRDRLTGQWLRDLRAPDRWQDIFYGRVPVGNACWRAEQLAARNDASVRCAPYGPLAYRVEATTNGTVGDTVVPGTEGRRATERATAVIEFRCSFATPPEGADTDEGAGDADADEGAEDADDAGDVELPSLLCDGKRWDLDPDDVSDLPEPQDLFDVHLAD
ncbi:pilus assembly protein TadG-related protein [Streptomyces sp. NPDC052077]|uniref:pilus assembly protein TadG-related protein n=1 Tax=Streptomyces sp. NPDC052077 TaxID=3154757 RepID=UPI00344A2790